ncbi:MAG: Uncharacterised protein [Polaribacter sejongensis]|nr:MAG: Uncharacterised protein [Polaribacter sejongensis]
MIKGGIKADKTVISYPNQPINPKAHTTPVMTTKSVMKVALKERKKKKKITAVMANAPPTKSAISLFIFCAFSVLI